ncbi:putative Heat shock chaperonin-binding protein [Rosa chinensis]|uniref:Protein TIC 40, chloroplastic n=1 Tax=Rosa chinensis TaxID=74649 RepID=A0A2P6SD63_ROSCH|nr:protein TIC 40, chloroplastic isoform X2 [Rosa chinensis]PRQ56621.1 putative Heat shock chaperonin-binding protein [Rosa chinensis]
MMSLSLPHSLPRSPPLQLNPPRIVPSSHRFTLFRCSASLRASLNSQNSRVSVRLPAANQPVATKLQVERFASISSSNSQETSSVGVNPQFSVPPPPSNTGSPLFWIGVGVAFSAVFSWAAGRLKNYAMQQAFKTVMGQMNSQNDQFSNAAFSPGSPFPFPAAPGSPSASPFSASAQPSFTDVSATRVDESPPASSASSATPSTPATDVKDEEKPKKEQKSYAFVDVTPEETVQQSPFESSLRDTEIGSSKEAKNNVEGSQNGAAFKQGTDAPMGSQNTGKENSVLSVEALEKMLEDPTVQKMVYPYLPEEMRNPTTFKWMLQNPQYRQQLEDMLRNMAGSSEWDNRMMDSLKNFDLSSPEVKQQFDQIGLTPEEVISKIMDNPDVARAFQNPRVQAAIMDCSQNPMSIAKYQNDKEVMDVFNKISELFPGVSGSP